MRIIAEFCGVMRSINYFSPSLTKIQKIDDDHFPCLDLKIYTKGLASSLASLGTEFPYRVNWHAGSRGAKMGRCGVLRSVDVHPLCGAERSGVKTRAERSGVWSENLTPRPTLVANAYRSESDKPAEIRESWILA